jgi:hypothetical protein
MGVEVLEPHGKSEFQREAVRRPDLAQPQERQSG